MPPAPDPATTRRDPIAGRHCCAKPPRNSAARTKAARKLRLVRRRNASQDSFDIARGTRTMNRRRALGLSCCALGLSVGMSSRASALLSCTPINLYGIRQCEAGIRSDVASVTAAAVAGQHLSEWCWAASIEMVFRYYGHRVPQEVIVQQTWGGIVNMPAGPGQILADLNRPWVDADGEQFAVTGDILSANAVTAVQDLASDMPLIIGTGGHCMVLTALQYAVYVGGPVQIISAVVRDPWPGRGKRNLTLLEWSSTSFLARIRVTG